MKNEWIKRLAKFSHEDPEMIGILTEHCPADFGLTGDCVRPGRMLCGNCWRLALEEYYMKQEKNK